MYNSYPTHIKMVTFVAILFPLFSACFLTIRLVAYEQYCFYVAVYQLILYWSWIMETSPVSLFCHWYLLSTALYPVFDIPTAKLSRFILMVWRMTAIFVLLSFFSPQCWYLCGWVWLIHSIYLLLDIQLNCKMRHLWNDAKQIRVIISQRLVNLCLKLLYHHLISFGCSSYFFFK